MKFKQLLTSIQTTHSHFQETAAKAVNRALTIRNWIIGHYIFEYEQKGEDRAKYGERLLAEIAQKLPDLKLSMTNLKLCRQFYLYYPQIWEVAKDELRKNTMRIGQSVTDQLQLIDYKSNEIYSNTKNNYTYSILLELPPEKLINNLSFTHIVALLILEDPLKRVFYEHECIKGNWGVRELKRQINSFYFERMGLSDDPEKLSRIIQQKTTQTITPADFIKNEYSFEFLGIADRLTVGETALQQRLLDHLQEFLMEMGHGFCLEGRQKKILIGREYFFIDLLFYHRILKCHVLVELKLDTFRHADVGQLNTYIQYYKAEMMQPGDNPPIGILLVADKDAALVKYATAGLDIDLFVSKYSIELPTQERLEKFIADELRRYDD
ncbi:PDDEXK nuclease domain-containing protein [Chitinophaga sp. 22536]|uniref:PDDEXK nuclease domain-containing protein n=1 Tax=unclassified Chitinophaga TaxID=2619133 RepID=UPI003F836B86